MAKTKTGFNCGWITGSLEKKQLGCACNTVLIIISWWYILYRITRNHVYSVTMNNYNLINWLPPWSILNNKGLQCEHTAQDSKKDVNVGGSEQLPVATPTRALVDYWKRWNFDSMYPFNFDRLLFFYLTLSGRSRSGLRLWEPPRWTPPLQLLTHQLQEQPQSKHPAVTCLHQKQHVKHPALLCQLLFRIALSLQCQYETLFGLTTSWDYQVCRTHWNMNLRHHFQHPWKLHQFHRPRRTQTVFRHALAVKTQVEAAVLTPAPAANPQTALTPAGVPGTTAADVAAALTRATTVDLMSPHAAPAQLRWKQQL